MTGKAISQSALGTLQTCAYALPNKGSLEHVGGRLGAVLSVVQFATMFIPDDQPTPPTDTPITREQLRSAIADVKAQIVDALWDSDLDDKQGGVLAMNYQLTRVTSAITSLKYDLVEAVMVEEPLHGLIADFEAYYNILAQNALYKRLESLKTKLEGGGITGTAVQKIPLLTRVPSVSLYLLTASLLVTYLKYAVTWQWTRQLVTNSRIDLCTAKLNKPGLDPQEKTGILAKYQDVLDDDSVVKSKDSWASFSQSGAVKLLKDDVKGMLDYCLGKPAENGNAAQVGLFTFMSNNQNCLGFDPAHDVGEPSEANPFMDELFSNRGTVSEFSQHIAGWRTTLASVCYQEHVMASGDTLIGLAQKYYSDGSKSGDLFAANGDVLTDANMLTVGTVLRIYDADQLAYAPRPKPPAQAN